MTTASSRFPAAAAARGARTRGPRRALGCALLALAQALPLPAPAQAVSPNALPALGDTASESLPIGTERRLGEQIMREIRRDPDYLDDPLLLEYLQSLWQPLLAAARARGEIGPDLDGRYAWEPFLVRDRTVNAFALPGGYVGVHLGLIAVTGTRDELASVLAHELTHVTQRHIARSIAYGKRASLVGVAALILGALAASRSNRSDAGSAIMQGGQAAAIQAQLNFSRDMEREADRVGFGVMTQAGYAPGGMAAMFEKLEHAARLNDSGNFPYLRSHPLTVDRIGEARARLGPGPVAAPPAAQLDHVLARARARVLMETRSEALQRWQGAEAASGAAPGSGEGALGRLAAAYSSALASTLLRDWPRADAALGRAQAPAREAGPRALRALALLQAQSALARGDAAAARAALAPAAGDGSRPVLLMQGQVALAAAGRAGARAEPGAAGEGDALARSAEALQTWVAAHPADALAWRTLAQTFERLGQRLRALRADAEAQLALGDLAGAVERLRAAQAATRAAGSAADFIEASVIDARLRDVEAQRRALAAEQRANGAPG